MATSTSSTAPIQNPLKKIFTPYFRARWQNYQNIVSNAVFFSKMPANWLMYQTAYVRQWDEWTRGFVLQLHRGDFFSIGIGKTVCEIITRECMKGRFRFDGENWNAVDFVTKWAESNNFSDIVQKGFLNANRLGNNILRLNVISGEGEVYPSTHAVDRVYFEVNRKEEISKARFLDYLSADTTSKTDYYTVEDRILIDGVPYYRVELFQNSGVVTNPTWVKVGRQITEMDLITQSRFRDLYGDIDNGEWYILPFKTLGCYNWKNSPTSTAINSMPGYAESSVHTALDILYSLDYDWSMAQLDQYWGRTRVIVPKEMQQKRGPVIYEGRTYDEAIYEASAPLNDDVFLQTPANGLISDKPTQPLFIQPDLRGEMHKLIRDSNLELLASKVGLSSTTLANHLTYNTSKTATEVVSETDTTDVTVANKRELAERAINALISDVLRFYFIVGEVDITWNTNGQNSQRNKDAILAEFNAQLMPRVEAIKRLHPELTQAEVEEWDKQLAQQNSIDDIFDTSKRFI